MYKQIQFYSPFADLYEKSLQPKPEPVKDPNPDPIIEMAPMVPTGPTEIGPGDPMFDQLSKITNIDQLKDQISSSAISDEMKKMFEANIAKHTKVKKPFKSLIAKLKSKRKEKLASLSRRRNRK